MAPLARSGWEDVPEGALSTGTVLGRTQYRVSLTPGRVPGKMPEKDDCGWFRPLSWLSGKVSYFPYFRSKVVEDGAPSWVGE